MNENHGVNRAKFYQLALFPMNNGATNVYFVLILSYIAQFGNAVLGLAMLFASFMVTGMRVFDAITDPIIGALMDKTNTKFGKFRPFMVIGNLIMAVSVLLLYVFTPLIPETMMWLRYILFILLYAVWVIGYTFQTSVTRSAQPVLTNDPNQRPLFTVFNTVGSLAGMGIMQVVGMVMAWDRFAGDYNETWYTIMTFVGIAISAILTVLAVIGIAEKDNEKYFGIGGGQQEALKISEYVEIIKSNKPLQRLMVAGGGCKLALAIAQNITVLIMLYGCMMGNYDTFNMVFMALGYVFSAPFFLLTVRTSQKEGQKASLMKYVKVALICYVGVLALLLMWQNGNPAFNLSLMGENGFAINLYTIAFILFFGIGYGAYYSTADMPIPMVADCADYETYRSGKFIPGIMGTLFSLVDKLVSSLASAVVSIALLFIGISDLPTKATPYADGMNWVVIALFCLVPMAAWILTLWAMNGYSLDGEKIKVIQAVNAARKAAVAGGMSMEEAMSTINDETVANVANKDNSSVKEENVMKYDYLIVGAGLFGAVLAERARAAGKKVLVIDKRDHVGGNIYTEDVEGIQVHKYGAHIFHTNDKTVWEYITKFAEFNRYTNSPVANYHGELYSLPFNMYTFNKMWGVVTPDEAAAKIAEQRAAAGITDPQNLEEQAISLVGTDIYERLVKGYTEKQWGRPCTELPAFIIRRLPVRLTFDNNYFNALYQGIPIGGYTAMVEKMLEGVEVKLGVDYLDNKEHYDSLADRVIYTGPIDRYFDYCYGYLGYRSVRFENEVLDTENYQGNAVINYTDRETPYTRIIEHKHFEFGKQEKTVISKEYSQEWQPGIEPYYPINDEKNGALYAKYKELADKETKTLFGGRLAEYRYYDMDAVIASALKTAEKEIR